MAKPTSIRRSLPAEPRVAILVDTSTTWGRNVIRGIHNYSRKKGRWHLFLEARGAEEVMALPDGWQGEGIIARVGNLELARRLARRHLPVVNVSGIHLTGPSFPGVASDGEATAQLAIRHFLDRGFKHFAYLNLRGLEYVARQRDTFVQTLSKMGFPCAVHSVKTQARFQSPHWNLRVDKLSAWLASLPKPVALFTWSGGREIIHLCQQAGLRVPEEIAVLNGSEDELLGELSPIPVSGIQAACQRIGYEAAALLDRMMTGSKAPAKPLLIPPVSVITRQSTDTMAISDQALISALAFIRQNVRRPIQVRDVAARAGVSRRVLERRFEETLGRSPAAHIGKVRLDQVKALLVDTDLPVNDVAEKCGFCSPEYMTAIFRKHLHTTPLRYRRETRGR